MAQPFGTFLAKMEDNGRLLLPAKTRPALVGSCYMTSGQDQCVFLFSEDQFDAYRARNQEQAPPGMPAIAFDRVFYSSVVTQAVDRQWRVTIPQHLRDYGGLKRDVALVGLPERIEIWDAAAWAEYSSAFTPIYAKLREGVR